MIRRIQDCRPKTTSIWKYEFRGPLSTSAKLAFGFIICVADVGMALMCLYLEIKRKNKLSSSLLSSIYILSYSQNKCCFHFSGSQTYLILTKYIQKISIFIVHRPCSAYPIFGLFGFFFRLEQCFFSQQFSQNSVFQPISAKLELLCPK